MQEQRLAAFELEGADEGPFAEPFERDSRHRRHFPGWRVVSITAGFFMSLVKDGGFRIGREGARPFLEFTTDSYERTMLALDADARDYRVESELQLLSDEVRPIEDGPPVSGQALAGVILRYQTDRHYYHAAIEGRRRLVIYRRADADWTVLAEQAVAPFDGFVKVEAWADGSALHVRCPELGAELSSTDDRYASGACGLRLLGRCRIRAAEVRQGALERAREAQARRRRVRREEADGDSLPEPLLAATIDLAGLHASPQFADFAEPGRHDMLLLGKSLTAVAADGRPLWDAPVRAGRVTFSAQPENGRRLIYAIAYAAGEGNAPPKPGEARELCVLDGATGALLARRSLDSLPPPRRNGRHLSPGTGNLTGRGSFDIVLRDDEGGGLWAYDRQLNLLWSQTEAPPYMGHSLAARLLDVDGDGLDEVLAGGRLFRGDGSPVWTHDLAPALTAEFPDEHYDHVEAGRFGVLPDDPPLAFLAAGGPGVYVVDARTGRTLHRHRIGHAQDMIAGAFRPGEPGRQVLVVNRWNCFTTWTLLGGDGRILWRAAPDHHYHGMPGVIDWPGAKHQLIWLNASAEGQAFYDGLGRRVKPLPALTALWGDSPPWVVSAGAARMGREPFHSLLIMVGSTLYVFKPDVS